MFHNANLYKVGLMNSQRHGGQRSTSVTFSTPEIPGAGKIGQTENVCLFCSYVFSVRTGQADRGINAPLRSHDRRVCQRW